MVKRPVKIYDFLEQLKDSLLLKAIMILIQKCYSISVCLHLGRKQPGLSQSYQLIWIVMMTDVGKPSIHEQSSSFMLLYRLTCVIVCQKWQQIPPSKFPTIQFGSIHLATEDITPTNIDLGDRGTFDRLQLKVCQHFVCGL